MAMVSPSITEGLPISGGLCRRPLHDGDTMAGGETSHAALFGATVR